MRSPIAIVGMACCYPNARTPVELWENVLAQRRAFRPPPELRIRLQDYLSSDPDFSNQLQSMEVGLIEDYEFDRVAFGVSGSTFRAADMTHWLALDIASRALTDAGFPHGDGLPRATTGVLLGNTLTGEFARSNAMLGRWPYVRRTVEASLVKQNFSSRKRLKLLKRIEAQYKTPFPPLTEETLAGNLSNTIAGRICNHFDLKGGGYTVDGACAASLLAVISGCTNLLEGDLDVALAGGVDLSLDPFELLGFAKLGALSHGEMRVFDTQSTGFWPGEGCGFVVLMRLQDAVAQKRRIYSVIRGWGVSSDGSGGITRPEVDGQILALQRAYHRAGFSIGSMVYFEAHGTGTSVGDATELKALSEARRDSGNEICLATVGSIKANIGHTKAAAGVAGIIKATMALDSQILPPTTGCEMPHPEITRRDSTLRILKKGEVWPSNLPLRAGVSAMGFGGINTHVVLEGISSRRRELLASHEQTTLSSAQDCELVMLDATDDIQLGRKLEHLSNFAAQLSRSEIADLASVLEKNLGTGKVRAAVVAKSARELAAKLETLRWWLRNGVETQLNTDAGIFLGRGKSTPRIGYLFPGQGSPVYPDGGMLGRRFDFFHDFYAAANLPMGPPTSTEVAQPTIVTSSVAALHILQKLGIESSIAIGHSLGELTALHWAAAFDEKALVRIAIVRGNTMAKFGNMPGLMASLRGGRQEVEALLKSTPVVIAAFNSPSQTVISGEQSAVAEVCRRAQASGLKMTYLPVAYAFHSPLMQAAVPEFETRVFCEEFRPLQRTVVSTVTGRPYGPSEDPRNSLCQQMTLPVRFTEALTVADDCVDLWLEVGPGQVLSGLVSEFLNTPVVSLDAGGSSIRGVLCAVASAFVLGTSIRPEVLFSQRYTRAFDLNWRHRFFVNPCELVPTVEGDFQSKILDPQESKRLAGKIIAQQNPVVTKAPLDVIRQLVSERTELPPSAITDDSRFLSDLHLSSITVSQLVIEAAQRLGQPPPIAPSNYSDATLSEAARALGEYARNGSRMVLTENETKPPLGIKPWIRTFTVEMVEKVLGCQRCRPTSGSWRSIAPPRHPLERLVRDALSASIDGHGIVVCTPNRGQQDLDLLAETAKEIAKVKSNLSRLVIIQQNGSWGPFARTVHLEMPEITTCVVDLPMDHPKAIDWIVSESLAATGYVEAHYDQWGNRRVPVLRVLPLTQERSDLELSSKDVLLVTGGTKGITFECALSVARETGARLAVIGRSQADEDVKTSANLRRIANFGVDFRYIAADLTDAEAVRAAIRKAESELGTITSILHGAGINDPQQIPYINETSLQRTIAPKVQGLVNVVDSIKTEKLRLIVTFGSIIARTGLQGEAEYGIANQMLSHLTEELQLQHSACRCICLEWSVWSGVGMGVGWLDKLERQGVVPIPIDEGIDVFRRLIRTPLPVVSVVITGRFGNQPTLQMEKPDLPFLRFLEQPRVYYPGVELIADSELSTGTDPYIEDHVFQGSQVFPAVMVLEAMAQVAMAVVAASDPPMFREVSFDRPVMVPKGATTTIRLIALVREPDCVDVVLRSSETAFQVDHSWATCQFESAPKLDNSKKLASETTDIPIVPNRDLYGELLFQSGRFKRLRNYKRLQATECIAEIESSKKPTWFARHLPETLVLGDPGARDAAMHAIQACVPHAFILPTGIKRLVHVSIPIDDSCFVHARERSREHNTFCYDLTITGSDGTTQELWEDLRVTIVGKSVRKSAWPESLLAPYIERYVQDLIPGSAFNVVINRDEYGDRHARANRAIQEIVGPTEIWRRYDGKAEILSDKKLSVAHSGNLTLAIAGLRRVGCDIETVVSRPPDTWRCLLRPEQFDLANVIMREMNENQNISWTRVWTATECLKKAGVMGNAPLIFIGSTKDGWVLLASGSLVTASFVARVRDVENQLVLAVSVTRKDKDFGGLTHGSNVLASGDLVV